MTRGLKQPVLLLAFLEPGNRDGPASGERCRVVDRDFVVQSVCVDAGEALDEMQVVACSAIVGPRREVGRVDDQRRPFPMTTRVSPPLTNCSWKVRASVGRNDAMETLSLARVIENRETSRSLHDSIERCEVRHHPAETPLWKAPVLWTIGPVHPVHVVEHGDLRAPR